jgi:thioredoxin 1
MPAGQDREGQRRRKPRQPRRSGRARHPGLFMFKDGQVVSNKVGAAPKAALENWIKSAI